jgi:Tol biopolymer transport system component
MTQRYHRLFSLVLLPIFLTMSACQLSGVSSAPPNTPIPVNTEPPMATDTPAPTDTPSPAPTATDQPVGRILAYMQTDNYTNSLVTVDLDYGTQKVLTPISHKLTEFGWSPDGLQIVYGTANGEENEVYSIPWNGSAEPTLLITAQGDGHNPIWSPDGQRIAFFSTRNGMWQLYTMDPTGGSLKALTGSTVYNSDVSWSPDSSAMAFNGWTNTQAPPFIVRVNADGSNLMQLTQSDTSERDPVWSPTGDEILFTTVISDRMQIVKIAADGSDRTVLTDSAGGNSDPIWSPDGSRIAFISWRDSITPDDCTSDACNYEIYVMNRDGSGQTNLTNNRAEDWGAAWSPDGSQIAFQTLRDEPLDPVVCDEFCNSEIYVIDASGENPQRITNNTVPNFAIAWRP